MTRKPRVASGAAVFNAQLAILALAVCALAACSGDDASGNGALGRGGPASDDAAGLDRPDAATFVPGLPPAAGACDDAIFDPGPALIRRMTRFEYNNTVRDLLGTSLRPADGFPPEEEMLGFRNNAEALQVSTLHAEHLMDAAELLSIDALDRLDTLVPCTPDEMGPRHCATRFIREFGRRAWRRPLGPAEVDRMLTLFDRSADLEHEDSAFRFGLQLIIQAFLQSPNFLYRIEVGEPEEGSSLRRLDDDELATRLSYLIWQSMPDDELFAKAESGALRTAYGLASEARRMFEDPRARHGLMEFFEQWLRIDAVARVHMDIDVFPTYRESLRALWQRETQHFIESLVWPKDEGGSLMRLFDAGYTYVNRELAEFYGYEGIDTEEFVKVDAPRRAGVLTQAGWLAAMSKPNMTSPVFRGVFIRRHVLCDVLPPPPANIAIVAPDPDPSQSTRQIFTEHSANPACAGCHTKIDPVGFAYENFDGVGLWRDEENGFPIDTRGMLIGTHDIDGEFDGAAELGALFASSDQVQRCVSRQVFRFAFGRGETNDDLCTLGVVHADFAAADFDFGALIESIAGSDAFRFRRVQHAPPPEE